MNSIDYQTIKRAAKGDLRSFEAIYRAYGGLVYRVAVRMVNNREDAEEVVQDVFLRIYDQLEKFRFESALKTWIYRIAINTTLKDSENQVS